MKELVLKNEKLGEMRRLTDVGYGIKVEGKKWKQINPDPYFEEIKRSLTFEEVKNIYTSRGFKVIYEA